MKGITQSTSILHISMGTRLAEWSKWMNGHFRISHLDCSEIILHLFASEKSAIRNVSIEEFQLLPDVHGNYNDVNREQFRLITIQKQLQCLLQTSTLTERAHSKTDNSHASIITNAVECRWLRPTQGTVALKVEPHPTKGLLGS
jgi:hypothetical protein